MDDATKKILEQMPRSEQESRFHQLCQNLGTIYPETLKGVEPSALSVKEFEEYEFLKKLLGFD